MFSAGATVATVTLSYLPIVTAAHTIAQGLKQETPAAKLTVEDNGLRFQLQSCQRNRAIVTCAILITNLDDKQQDLQIRIYGNGFGNNNSRSIDSSGNQYLPNQIQLGSEKSPSDAYTNLIPNVPIKGSLSFELPQQITNLSAVEVSYFTNADYKVNFQDVSISNSQASKTTNNRNNQNCSPSARPTKR